MLEGAERTQGVVVDLEGSERGICNRAPPQVPLVEPVTKDARDPIRDQVLHLYNPLCYRGDVPNSSPNATHYSCPVHNAYATQHFVESKWSLKGTGHSTAV